MFSPLPSRILMASVNSSQILTTSARVTVLPLLVMSAIKSSNVAVTSTCVIARNFPLLAGKLLL